MSLSLSLCTEGTLPSPYPHRTAHSRQHRGPGGGEPARAVPIRRGGGSAAHGGGSGGAADGGGGGSGRSSSGSGRSSSGGSSAVPAGGAAPPARGRPAGELRAGPAGGAGGERRGRRGGDRDGAGAPLPAQEGGQGGGSRHAGVRSRSLAACPGHRGLERRSPAPAEPCPAVLPLRAGSGLRSRGFISRPLPARPGASLVPVPAGSRCLPSRRPCLLGRDAGTVPFSAVTVPFSAATHVLISAGLAPVLSSSERVPAPARRAAEGAERFSCSGHCPRCPRGTSELLCLVAAPRQPFQEALGVKAACGSLCPDFLPGPQLAWKEMRLLVAGDQWSSKEHSLQRLALG